MAVSPNTKLSDLRRPVKRHFKTHFDEGFIFLCKSKEIVKAKEKQLTIFDILPKLPTLTMTDRERANNRRKRLPSENFVYPGVQYKELSHEIEGRRHLVMCACVIFLFEWSKVSHWPPDKLRVELSANMLEGFCFIPSDIMSWKEKLVEGRATSIHGYAACNQKKELEIAIQQLSDMAYVQNMKDQRGAVPLHYAAENGHLEICEILVAAIGKDMIYQQDVNRKTPLHCALYRRKLKTITYLLQMNSDLVRPDIYGNTCLDLIRQQTSKDIDFIITKLQLDCIDGGLKYYLAYVAIKNSNIKQSRQLTEKLQVRHDDQLGESLLHIAVDLGDKDVIENLIRNNFDLARRDVKQHLPFHRACVKGNKQLANLLFFPGMDDSDISKGAVLAMKSMCSSICTDLRAQKPSLVMEELSVCSMTQQLDAELRKVNKGGKGRERDLKDWEDTFKNVIPLLQKEEGVLESYVVDCSYHNLPNSLIMLKSLGASFNERDYMGRSPLHEATQNNSCKAIEILLKGKGNPNLVDWRGSSPLHYACEKGNLQSVKVLMASSQQLKADIQNACGRTPLLEACYRRRYEVVQYLVSGHAGVIGIHATDIYGQCILHHLSEMPDKLVDLVLAKCLSVEKSEDRKNFKTTRWKDSVRTTAWSRDIISTSFRAKVFTDKWFACFVDPNTDDRSDSPFDHKYSVASWNSRITNVSFTEDDTIKKSPKKEMNTCTRCKVFFSKRPHRCTRQGKRVHQEGTIHSIVYRAFRHHYALVDDSISPVFNAANAGNTGLVKKLLKFDQTYMSSADNFGRSLMELAIDQGSVKLMQALVEIQPSDPNPTLVHRVLMQRKKTKGYNARNALLSILISKGHFVDRFLETGIVSHDECVIRKGQFCYRQCYLKGYTPLEVVVRNNDEELFKMVLDKSSGKYKTASLLLAAYNGNHSMLEAIKKKVYSQKKDKVDDEDDDLGEESTDAMDERILLDIACRSPNVTLDMIRVIGKLFPQMLEQNTAGILTEYPASRRYLRFDIPREAFLETTSLAKLMSEARGRRSRILARSNLEDIACQLIEDGINLGKVFPDTHSNRISDGSFIHGACECFQKALEGKFYKAAEKILQNEAATIWKCAVHPTHCGVQDVLPRNVVGGVKSYIDYILTLGCLEETPKCIMQLLLQSGFKEFDKEMTVSLEAANDSNTSQVEINESPFTKMITRATHTVVHNSYHNVYDVYKLVELYPKMMDILREYSGRSFRGPKAGDSLRCFVRTCVHIPLTCAHVFEEKNHRRCLTPINLPQGLTLLHLMCALDNVEFVNEFLKCGTDVDINAKTDNGITAIDVAAVCGNWNVFKVLLDNNANPTNDTLLACCCTERHKGMNFWINRIHSVHGKPTATDKQRQKMVKELCNRKDVIDFSYYDDAEGCALGAALQSRLWGVAEYLCSVSSATAVVPMLQGLSKRSNVGWAREAPKDLVRIIVESSPKQSSLAMKGLAYVLHNITKRSDFEFVDTVIKHLDTTISDATMWPTICQEKDKRGMNIVHHLCYIGHAQALEIVAKKLNREIHIMNHTNNSAASPLWYALANQHWSTAKLMLLFGSRVCTKRPIPDFEPHRPCTPEQSRQREDAIHSKSVRFFQERKNDSTAVHGCFSSKPTLSKTKKDSKVKTDSQPKPIRKRYAVGKMNTERGAVKRLCTIAFTAEEAGCDLIHAACGAGNAELVAEILKIRPDAIQQKDGDGFYPLAYAIIGGNEDVIDMMTGCMSEDIANTSLEPFMWKLASSEKTGGLQRAFSQFLGYLYDDNKQDSNSDISAKVKLPPFRWGRFNSERLWLDVHDALELYFRERSFSEDSIDQMMKDINTLRDRLLNRNPLDSFLYFNQRKETALSEDCARTLLTLILRHIQDINNSDILTLILMQKPWIFKILLNTRNSNGNLLQMKKSLFSKYSVIDCLFIFASPEDERLHSGGKPQLKLHIYVQEIMNIFKLNLSPGIGTLAVQKNLWKFLEHALQHTYETEGILSDEWHTILATGAERGQMTFLRSIFDHLHIPRMTADQKSCFTAYLCLAGRAGKTDVIKYLLRHNVPPVGSMDEYPIKDILGKRYKESWNILHYVMYSKSESSLKEILSVLKSERDFLKNLKVDECIHESGKTGISGMVNTMILFLSVTKNETLPQSKWNAFLLTAASRGHEDLCIYLIEKKSADAIAFDNNNMTPLHYCGYFGMKKLAEKFLERQPSALEKTDLRELTSKDYANAMGRPRMFSGAKRNVNRQSVECNGWLRCLLEENSLVQEQAGELTISPQAFMARDLTLEALLVRFDDHASTSIIKWSQQDIVQLAKENPMECVLYFILSARYKCNNALQALCNAFEPTENNQQLKTILLMNQTTKAYGSNTLTPLGWAIKVQNTEAIDILMAIEPSLHWRDTYSHENILHLAVKTENVSIAQHVNDKSDGKLLSEADRHNITPLAVAVALGLHRTLRVLTKNNLHFTSSHDKHSGDRVDYSCVECLLDHCIGWSKTYLSGDFENVSTEEVTRSIFQQQNTRGYVTERVPIRVQPSGYTRKYPDYTRNIKRISEIPFDIRHLCIENEDKKSYQLHKIHKINAWCGPNSKPVKSALFSMGYQAREETLQWIMVRSITDPFEAAKKAVRAGFMELTVKFISQLDDEKALDVFEAAAVEGKEYILEKCAERVHSLMTDTTDPKSIIESAVAFGQINVAVRLLLSTQTSGYEEPFASFRYILEAIPQKIMWLMNDELPGDTHWLEDMDQSERLTLPDIWLSMNESNLLRAFVEEAIQVETLLPETIKGKKFVPDVESFRKHTYYRENGNIWIRCFMASSQIFGNARDLLEVEDPKSATINVVRISCLPLSSTDHPKVSVESNGMLQETLSVAMYNDVPMIQHDASFALRANESSLRDVVHTTTIPQMERQLFSEFGLTIRISVDWSSIDTRKRTSGSESITKILTGEHFHNALGGLQDVLNDCADIKDTIQSLFNDETVKLALRPLNGMKMITVTFVDSLSGNDGQQRSRISAQDGNVIWRFVLDRASLKYDRTTFPLWFHLNRYRSACVAFCDSIHRISHIHPPSVCSDCTERATSIYRRRRQRRITLEIEWSSFQTNNEQVFMELVGHGIARELQAMAYESEAMLRLRMSNNHVIVKNSASVLFTGVTVQGKYINAAVYVHQTAKKNWIVENGVTSSKLGDLEDKQLISTWDSGMFSEINSNISKTIEKAEERFGLNIEIMFDEKRILAPLLLKCRREITHPQELIRQAINEYLDALLFVYEQATLQLLSGPYVSYAKQMNPLSVASGVWKCHTTPVARKGTDVKQPKTLLTLTRTTSASKCVEDYSYGDKVKLAIVPEADVGNPDVLANSWEFASPTSTFIRRGNSSVVHHIRYISCYGRMYEVLDHKALLRTLCKLPTKAVVGNDVLESLEFGADERLFSKLFPALVKDIHASSKSVGIPVMYDSLSRVNCLYGVSRVRNIVVDWDELFDSAKMDPPDNLRCVQGVLRILNDTLIEAYRENGMFCNLKIRNMESPSESLKKISILQLTKISDDFKPDSSVLRIIKSPGKSLPELHVRQGNEVTIAYRHFKTMGTFKDSLLTAVAHVLEIEVKGYIEKGIGKNPEKDKWRKKQYDGPHTLRPDLCYVEQILPNILSALTVVMDTTEGKEALLSYFVDFQFAKTNSDKTRIDFEEDWMICWLSHQDLGANMCSLLQKALGIKTTLVKSPVLQFKDTNFHFISSQENALHVTVTDGHRNAFPTNEQLEMCDPSNFTVQFWSDEDPKRSSIKPNSVTLDEDNGAIQIKWTKKTESHAHSMGSAQLVYKDMIVDRPVKTYFCGKDETLELSTELASRDGELVIQTGGHVRVVVDHDTECHVIDRYAKTESNQKTEDLTNGFQIVVCQNMTFLIKAKKRTYQQPRCPVKITTKYFDRYSSYCSDKGIRGAQCIKIRCLDKSRCVRIRARCQRCGSSLRMITPSTSIRPGRDMIINPPWAKTLHQC